jgi:hypothetical protein
MLFSIPGLASCSKHQHPSAAAYTVWQHVQYSSSSARPPVTVFVFHMATVGERDPDENYRIWRRMLTFG